VKHDHGAALDQLYRRARRQGIAAVGIAVLASAWWIHSNGWQTNNYTTGAGRLLDLVGPLLILLLVAGAFRAVPRHRNVFLALVPGHGLVAPGSTTWLWQAALTVTLGGAIMGSNQDSAHADAFNGVLPAVGLIGGGLCFAVGAVLAALTLGWPARIALTKDGLQYTNGFRTVIAPWSALEQQPVAAPKPGLAAALQLPVSQPERIRGGRADHGWLTLPAHHFFVNPDLLADTVSLYLNHPEYRTELGSPDGYARLTATLRPGTGAANPGK
jgi:hypothetical protein